MIQIIDLNTNFFEVQLAKKLQELEKKYDAQFKVVFDAIHALLEPPKKPKRRIGFDTGAIRDNQKI